MTRPLTQAEQDCAAQQSLQQMAFELSDALDELFGVLVQQRHKHWDYELSVFDGDRGFSFSDDGADEKRAEMVASAEAELRRIAMRHESLHAALDALLAKASRP